MRNTAIVLILFFFFAFQPKLSSGTDTNELMVFCGASFKRPIEEIAESFQTKTGIKVNSVYAGIGTLFSQISLTKQGDILIAPSPDIMEKATVKGPTFLVLGQVDAIIGFHYLEGWYPDKVETVKLKSEQIQRIGSGQIGILTDSHRRELSQKFIHFVVSDDATRILHKYRYFGSPEEAFAWMGAKKPIGGEYSVPSDWVGK